MDLKEAERRYLHLQKLHEQGELDGPAFKLEAAKLLVRDGQGAFWMVDPDQAQWYRNQGTGWIEADPGSADGVRPAPDTRRRRGLGRRRTSSLLGAALALILVVAAVFAFLGWPAKLWSFSAPPPTAIPAVQVTIASPSAGSSVASGQEVAVEVTLRAGSALESVARVELQVDGQVVDSRSVGPVLQPGGASLPLSLPWRPQTIGDHDLAVVVRSAADDVLGQATVSVHVAEAPVEALPEPACTAGAALLSHVTIPAGTAFQPGARMDKVWQVRNSGTCAWGVGYELIQTAGDSLGTAGSAAVPPAAAGDRLNLEIAFWAPQETGVYTGAWQLRTPAGILFGPTLTVAIEVKALAEPGEPPAGPTRLSATLAEDARSIVLTWDDLSDNEDAFRIYRDDIAASIGLVPADTTLFVDRAVACGNTYRYRVAAFNAAGPSPSYRASPVKMPACVPVDTPPTLTLTAEPREIAPGASLQLLFQASDDTGVVDVTIQGENTGDPELDAGQVFTCEGAMCRGSWTFVVTGALSGSLSFVAHATDTAGQASAPARVEVRIVPVSEGTFRNISPWRASCLAGHRRLDRVQEKEC